jgi:hypothetical protein
MGSISKSFALILILLITISCLIMINPTFAQSIPTPSVPTFTVRFVSTSHSVTTTDPYTGKSTTQQYENNNIQITIKNQPFPAALNGNTSNLYYNIQIKGHFADYWTDQYAYSDVSPVNLPTQSNSEYTVLFLPANYQSGDKVDIQVEAMLGYQYSDWYSGPQHDAPFMEYNFIYQASGWSPTQTFTMPITIAVLLSIIVAVAVVALLIIIVSLLLYRRHRKTVNLNQ